MEALRRHVARTLQAYQQQLQQIKEKERQSAHSRGDAFYYLRHVVCERLEGITQWLQTWQADLDRPHEQRDQDPWPAAAPVDVAISSAQPPTPTPAAGPQERSGLGAYGSWQAPLAASPASDQPAQGHAPPLPSLLGSAEQPVRDTLVRSGVYEVFSGGLNVHEDGTPVAVMDPAVETEPQQPLPPIVGLGSPQHMPKGLKLAGTVTLEATAEAAEVSGRRPSLGAQAMVVARELAASGGVSSAAVTAGAGGQEPLPVLQRFEATLLVDGLVVMPPASAIAKEMDELFDAIREALDNA